MNDWRKLAQTFDPPLPPEDVPAVAAALERLEAALRPLREKLSVDAPLWTGPGNTA
jgi:hypothetical protein